MGKILDRIQQLAKAEGITITGLERSIGASKGVLSRAINNQTDIQAKWLQKIVENYPHISADWLVTGRGDMRIGNVRSAMEYNKQQLIHQLLSNGEKTQFIYSPDFESSFVLKLFEQVRQDAIRIGQLEEQISQLKMRLQKNADAANTENTAHAG